MFIVTGASKGLGKAICSRLIKNNIQVDDELPPEDSKIEPMRNS